jgi:putative tricarboxylic transport membrane protein
MAVSDCRYRTPLFRFAAVALLGLLQMSCDAGNHEYATGAGADWTPSRAVEFIAPANPGGGWDTLVRTSARVIAMEGLAEQNFAPINMPGGGGAVAWAQVARDRGNPHKLFATSPPLILVPLAGNSRFGYEDFTPIARLSTDYIVVLVREDSQYQSINELLAQMALAPAEMSYAGGSSAGSMDHVAIAGIASAYGLDPKTVNYISFSGGGEAIVNLIGGHVDVAVVAAAEALGHIEGHQVRALGISSAERIDALKDVPTFREQGVDYRFDVWRGVMGPGNLSPVVVRYYESVFSKMVNTDGWRAASEQLGWINTYQDSAAFRDFLADQDRQFREILLKLGMLRR